MKRLGTENRTCRLITPFFIRWRGPVSRSLPSKALECEAEKLNSLAEGLCSAEWISGIHMRPEKRRPPIDDRFAKYRGVCDQEGKPV